MGLRKKETIFCSRSREHFLKFFTSLYPKISSHNSSASEKTNFLTRTKENKYIRISSHDSYTTVHILLSMRREREKEGVSEIPLEMCFRGMEGGKVGVGEEGEEGEEGEDNYPNVMDGGTNSITPFAPSLPYSILRQRGRV